SCTGYLVPSLDVHLIPRLGLRRDVRRLPLTELGCSGGLAGLALGHEWAQGRADARVLIVAVELPSLNLQPDDRSLDNLTASMVFGDGAAAAVLSSAPARPGDVEVTAVASQLLPDSVDALGFDLRDDGFHTVLQPRLAKVVGDRLRPVVDGFWEGPPPAFYAIHAGGARIFDAVRDALQLEDAMLEPSRSVWGRTGNLSSASILFVLAELAGSGPGCPRNGAAGTPPGGEAAGDGLAIAFGPGVTVELARLRRAPG
ncbi:MAG: type III polyketide synthase, partial [Candidatus Dormiibacterota bacterium]